jgi:DNA recombination protein RmuC
MLPDWTLLVVAALAVGNLALIGWVVLLVRARAGGTDELAFGLCGRFDAIERHNEVLRRALNDMDQGLRREIADGARDGLVTAFDKVQEGTKAQAEGLTHVQGALNQLADTVRGGFDGFSQRLREEQELLRGRVDENLEKMRLTVDEKLQATLEQRLGASFKQVNESLEQVYKSVGEMQALAVGVGDLKRVLGNIKSRGTWTEIGLEALLADILAPDQYGRNVEINPGSNQRVEFAIRLPGDETVPVWLAIDVKFPTADYERLSLAAERGDRAEVDQASRAVELRIRDSARDICTKYVHPPHSTDFAVMYLPTEGLFAEIVRRPGLVDALQRECHVMVAGPTTLYTLLTAMRMGFKSLAIQKRSTEVWKVLGAVKHEFGKFGDVIDKVSKKLDDAQKVIDDEIGVRRRAMARQLRAVETLPEAETTALLEYDGGDDDPGPLETRAAAE